VAAVMAEGVTVIEKCGERTACCRYANIFKPDGGKISRAQAPTLSKIIGVETLHPATYSVIPDQITAGTYMIAAAATQGDVS
jgi:UDP-N-acetylglucosamine 1-carboxyvinyltransferase